MRYLLFKVCAALKLLESFSAQSCTRGSQFSLQLDNHYDETLITAKIQSPDFLNINTRSTTSSSISSIYTRFPIDIIAIAHTSDILIVLESESLLMFNISNIWSPELLQRYMVKDLNAYKKIVLGSFAVIYGDKNFAIIKYDKLFPVLISEFPAESYITSLGIFSDKIIYADSTTLRVVIVEDLEIGTIRTLEVLKASNFQLGYLNITSIYSQNSNLLIIESQLGLLKLSLNPLKIEKVYNIFGSLIAGHENTVTVDGKYEIDIFQGTVKTYNLTQNCDHLGIDSEFIYCGSEDKVFYISRLISIVSESSFNPIHDLLIVPPLAFVAFSNGVEVRSVTLGPLYIQGEVPDEVVEYKVEFTVWGSSEEFDNQKFELSVQYSVTDVIYFILFCLSGFIFIVVGAILVIKYCKKEVPEVAPSIPIVHRGSSSANYPGLTERVFSERVLIQNSQA